MISGLNVRKEELSERQKKLIGIVEALPEKPVNISLLQKIVFLCMEQLKKCDIKYTYRVGHYGNFSPDLILDINDLQKRRVVQVKGNTLIIRSQPKEKWLDAKDTVDAFCAKFPDEYTVVKSAINSPNVRGHSVGEVIEIAE